MHGSLVFDAGKSWAATIGRPSISCRSTITAVEHEEHQRQPDIDHDGAVAAVASKDDPTRWQQDARVGALAALLVFGGGLVALGGWLVGSWVGLAVVALGGGALAVRRWRRRGALLPRDIGGRVLVSVAVLVGLVWLVTNSLSA